jgi:2-phospho-L-lactate guanylyltransferase
MLVLAVPVRRLEDAKTRLAPILSPRERGELMLAMLHDVVTAATRQAAWETWVVSADRTVLDAAEAHGATPVREPGTGLLAAVRYVEDLALRRGAGELAVLLADLPWITKGSLAGALGVDAPVVAVRAASDGGTNLLVRRPPNAIRARFGRESYAKHRWAAQRAGVAVRTVESDELAFDLDGPGDLRRLLASGRPCGALTTCREMGVAERLRLHAENRGFVEPTKGGGMQGTVKEFDHESRVGSLLTDDGSEVAIDPTSTEGSEIRSLRIGQRVDFDLAQGSVGPVARGLHIVTFA